MQRLLRLTAISRTDHAAQSAPTPRGRRCGFEVPGALAALVGVAATGGAVAATPAADADALVADFVYQGLALQPVTPRPPAITSMKACGWTGSGMITAPPGSPSSGNSSRRSSGGSTPCRTRSSMPSAAPISTSFATPWPRPARARSHPGLPPQPDALRRADRQRPVHALQPELCAPRPALPRPHRAPAGTAACCWRRPWRTCATRPKSGIAWRARTTTATSSSWTTRCARRRPPRCKRPTRTRPARRCNRSATSATSSPRRSPAKTSDWRLGKDELRAQVPLHAAHRAGHRAAAGGRRGGPRRDARRIGAAGRAAQRHRCAGRICARSTRPPPTYMDEVRGTLVQATSFVRQHDLLSLADNGNLAVVETPAFMRASLPVGGFNPAPPLEPQLGAYYWVTPIPSTGRPGASNPSCANTTFSACSSSRSTRPCPGTTCSSSTPTASSRPRAACCAASGATAPTSRAGRSTRSSS